MSCARRMGLASPEDVLAARLETADVALRRGVPVPNPVGVPAP